MECHEPINSGDMIVLTTKNDPLCLTCADFDHLVFLPYGNTVLTKRSQKHSNLSAIVYKFSKARKRNERQGVLVESQALEMAEKECLADEDVRQRNRERDAVRREKLDQKYIKKFAEKIAELYPNCPEGIANLIAEHACLKHSGRVGRSASAKDFNKNAILLAVQAHIRHSDTDYDRLLSEGYERYDARQIVREQINDVLGRWSQSK
jgi:hypothetical protein